MISYQDRETLFVIAQRLYESRSWRKECFEAAATLVTELPASIDARVVHGLPTGRGGDASSQVYLHAWVEVGDAVFDLATGPQPIPQLLYYALGRIETVVKFTQDEVFENIDTYENHGPWPSSPKGATLERPE